MKRVILASASPRRRMLLEQAGLEFEIKVSDAAEDISGKSPEDTVKELSMRKADSIGSITGGDCIILAADTVVACDDVILGKPENEKDAMRMLRMLQGRTHQVYTGVSVLAPSGRIITETDRSDVTFCPVPDTEILDYVRTGEPMDKAGAYALQGRASLWITRLEGSYSSVIGLPLYLVRSLLLRSGYRFSSSADH